MRDLSKPSTIDRLSIRERPDGQQLMHQAWGKLLFRHWRIEEHEVRSLIPAELEIDTFDGTAWIGIIPFTMWDIRALPPLVPAVPGLSSAHELNVRTYVHYDNVPGVWFFSLDCNSIAAVMAARAFYHLPYYNAAIDLEQQGNTIDYSLIRAPDGLPAGFNASWNMGETKAFSHPDSLDFFLTERYCLYSEKEGDLYRARIFHQPWPLQEATINSYESTMIESLGVRSPKGEPVLRYAEAIDVYIWAIKRV